MMNWYGEHMSGWGWMLMTVGSVAFWGLLIAGIVLLVRNTSSGAPASEQPLSRTSPQQLLSERFARGEINEDEYTNRLVVLDARERS